MSAVTNTAMAEKKTGPGSDHCADEAGWTVLSSAVELPPSIYLSFLQASFTSVLVPGFLMLQLPSPHPLCYMIPFPAAQVQGHIVVISIPHSVMVLSSKKFRDWLKAVVTADTGGHSN